MHLPRAWLMLNVADLSHLRLARQAVIEDRPELLQRSKVLRTAEFSAASAVDAVLTHSSHEAELLAAEVPPAKIHPVGWSFEARPTPIPFAKRCGLAFIGSYQHDPNLDAALTLVRDIMPLVWQTDPTIPCHLIGSDMPDQLRRLASDRIIVHGHVPDLATILNRLRLTVAPLAYGAGVKGKVLQSLAAAIPCVCTPIAAEGLALPPLLTRQIAATPELFAERILQLHTSPAANKASAAIGLAYIRTHHSDTRIRAELLRALPPHLRDVVSPEGKIVSRQNLPMSGGGTG